MVKRLLKIRDKSLYILCMFKGAGVRERAARGGDSARQRSKWPSCKWDSLGSARNACYMLCEGVKMCTFLISIDVSCPFSIIMQGGKVECGAKNVFFFFPPSLPCVVVSPLPTYVETSPSPTTTLKYEHNRSIKHKTISLTTTL